MSVALISAISTVAAAVVAGWFAFLARRASAHGPESVAGGYSKLVNDMRTQQESLQLRVAELEREKNEQRRQIGLLLRQVAWLMEHVPVEQQQKFANLFADTEDGHVDP